MKVVLDTNVFISGIFWTGDCNKLINCWGKEKFKLIISLEIISELIKILKDFKIQLPEGIIKEWIDLIIRNSIIVKPEEKFEIVKDDPKDNIFIEAAFAEKSDFIISQDKHLLKLKEFRGIKIITPDAFLKIIE